MIAERPPAGQQLEEQQAEGVDVGRGGDRLAGELLGAGVLGRREAQRRARLPSPVGAGRFRVEELGDAEVEEPHLAALGQQDVGRLEIAMDDEVNMGVVHRLADLLEQDQPLVEAESPLVGGDGERPAVDVLEGEVGDAGVVDAAVEELRDAAMREAGKASRSIPKRRRSSLLSSPRRIRFSATWRRNPGSSRSASQTSPMPPSPSSLSSR